MSFNNNPIFTGMLAEGVLSEKSFDWLKMMRYQMDIRSVLRAKTEPIETGSQTVVAQQEIPVEIKRKTSRARRSSLLGMKTRMQPIGKPMATPIALQC